MPTYKNISGLDLVIPNVGEVKKDGTITKDFDIENPNLQLVGVNKTESPPEKPKS